MFTFAIRYWYFIAIALLLAALGVEHMRGNNARTEVYKLRADFAEVKEKAAQQAQDAERAARETEQLRQQRIEEIQDEADQRTAIAQAAADSADRAAAGLRARLASLVANARSGAANPGPASSGKAADPVTVLAELLGRLDQAAGRYAAAADSARIAGLACESAYSSLGR
jgi:hypothetical protein